MRHGTLDWGPQGAHEQADVVTESSSARAHWGQGADHPARAKWQQEHSKSEHRNKNLARQEDAGPEESDASYNDQMTLESNNRGAVGLKQEDQ